MLWLGSEAFFLRCCWFVICFCTNWCCFVVFYVIFFAVLFLLLCIYFVTDTLFKLWLSLVRIIFGNTTACWLPFLHLLMFFLPFYYIVFLAFLQVLRSCYFCRFCVVMTRVLFFLFICVSVSTMTWLCDRVLCVRSIFCFCFLLIIDLIFQFMVVLLCRFALVTVAFCVGSFHAFECLLFPWYVIILFWIIGSTESYPFVSVADVCQHASVTNFWLSLYAHLRLFSSLICLLFALARPNIVICTHAYPSLTICSHVCPYTSSLCMITFAEFSPVIGHHASYICPCVTMCVSPCRVFVFTSSFGPYRTHLTYLLSFTTLLTLMWACHNKYDFILFLITLSKLKIVNIYEYFTNNICFFLLIYDINMHNTYTDP